jgi:hypothetical protein
VPFSALEKVRADWKSKAAAHEAEARVLRQQLDEFKRAQAAPPPMPPQPVPQWQPPPDPATDPVGALQHMQRQQQQMLLNERLNMSEAVVSERIGAEDLGKYVAEFKAAAEKEPSLWGKLYAQPNPYGWMTREIDAMRKRAEIGDDPAAYETKMRAKLEAEFRAKWDAEAGQQEPPRQPATAGMQPSLASVRSVAGRATPTFSGPPPLEDLFPGHNRRPNANGAARH